MIDQAQRGKKVSDRLDEIGLPNKRYGDARDRAEIFGVTAEVMRNWTSGRNATPNWLWRAMKMWELLPPEKKDEYRNWCREKD